MGREEKRDTDNRIRLPKGYQLRSEVREYIIEKCVGAGSNSIIYQAIYRDSLMSNKIHTILVKELYPYDFTGGIARNEKMELCIAEETQDFFQMHKASYLMGNHIHLTLNEAGSGNIAENLDSFEQNGTLYTIFTARKGETLADFLQERDFHSLTEIILCICNLLHTLSIFHAHGYLHLDISPDNLFLLFPAETGRTPSELLLLDFNSIYDMKKPFTEEDNRYCFGKEGYMAPELVLHHREEFGPWTDLYSVSVILYFLLTDGRIPCDMELFEGEELISPYSRFLLHEKEVSAQRVNRILKKGLQVLPSERYQNTREMLQDFQEMLQILNGELRIPLLPQQSVPKSKIPPFLKAGMVLALVGTFVLGGYLGGRPAQIETEKPDLTKYDLETDPSVVLTQFNVRHPLENNIMEVQVQDQTAVRVQLKDMSYERNEKDVLAAYSLFQFYNGKGDKRGWQLEDMTYDFFYTEDNVIHMELPFYDTNHYPLEYIGIVFQNFNYDESSVALDIRSCTLTDGFGKSHEMTELLGTHLLFFDKEHWQHSMITSQNQDYVEDFADIYGGNLSAEVAVTYLDPVFEVRWSSDHPEIAAVDARGRVEGRRQGIATLTAEVKNKQTGELRSTQMLVHVISRLP